MVGQAGQAGQTQGGKDEPLAFARTEEGKIKPFQSNLVELLTRSPEFENGIRFCEFRGRIMKTQKMPWSQRANVEWSDQDTLELRNYVEGQLRWSPNPLLVLSAVQTVANRNPIHLVQDFLKGLEWDGIPRIDSWLTKHLGVKDNIYTKAVGRKFLISAVARVMQPGCKVDAALVLEGPQGIGKSSSIRALAPWPSVVWDSPLDLNHKDGQISLQGHWFIELSELDSLGKAAVSRIKSFLSLQEDRYRAPYARLAQSFPRQCVFVGTTNESEYLKDATGGRRFWPVKCADAQIDIKGLTQVRDQLWAEATGAFQAGEWWHLSIEEEEFARQEQELRRRQDPDEEKILAFVVGKEDVTLSEVLSKALGIENFDVRSRAAYRVSHILLERLAWTKGKVHRGGIRVQGYYPPDGFEAQYRHVPEQEQEEPSLEASALDPYDDDEF